MLRKLQFLVLIAATAIAIVGCASTKGASKDGASPLGGGYDVKQTVLVGQNGDLSIKGQSSDLMMFTVDGDGTLSGAMEDSGWTVFLGAVGADGSFTAEFYKIGGTMTGTIGADGSVKGTYDMGKFGSGELAGKRKGS